MNPEPLSPAAIDLGVNAIGSWTATTGLAEAARRIVSAMVGARVPVALDDFDYGAPRDPRRLPTQLQGLPRGRPHGIDLCVLNINEIATVAQDYLRLPHRDHYLIGYWYWELPTLPREIAAQIDRVDEVWVATEFVRHAMLGYASCPVTVVPAVVDPPVVAAFDLAGLGVKAGATTYLNFFDAHSTLARKNPFGFIEAFARAFGPSERGSQAQLILKSINLAGLPEARERVRAAVESVDGILIEDELRFEDMMSLVGTCDVFVSLHRSEGFGLGLAEAMCFGRAAVATAYSGNVDFMSLDNSCPVSYSMTTIEESQLRLNPGMEKVYVPGMLWAEPDLDDAARWMRWLHDRPIERARIGAAGQQTIREHYSEAAAGRAIAARLNAIALGRPPKKLTLLL